MVRFLVPELDVASQGETIEEAIENLKEAVELYLEDEDVQIIKFQGKTCKKYSDLKTLNQKKFS